MTNLEIQTQITQNLLLGLKSQSEAYLLLIQDSQYTHEQRKDFEKELSDINKVLTELGSKALSYTVQELEQLKITFNNKLIELDNIVTDLDLNTLKIEFNSLTPEQKTFLKGEKGDRGYSSFESAKLLGFVGNEIDYLNSLRGATGPQGLAGADGPIGLTGPQGPAGLNGPAGANGETGPQGPAGLTGPAGADGLIGLTGPQGPAGAGGEVGPQGPAGLNGPAGANGETGPQGPAGENGLDGLVTFESLTPEQIKILKGEAGPIGLTGPQGPAGVNGLDGSIGPQGPAGADGSVAFESLTSEQIEILRGETGPIGETGPTGLTGPQGPAGLGGGSDNPNFKIFYSRPASSDVYPFLHLKTNLLMNASSPLVLELVGFSYFSAVSVAEKISLMFSGSGSLLGAPVVIDRAGHSLFHSAYVSSEGFLCFCFNHLRFLSFNAFLHSFGYMSEFLSLSSIEVLQSVGNDSSTKQY